MEQNEIKFSKDNNGFIIHIPFELITWVAENNPTDPVIVHNKDKFEQAVMFQVEHNLGSMESGLSGFQELLDKAIAEVSSNGEDFCEPLNYSRKECIYHECPNPFACKESCQNINQP